MILGAIAIFQLLLLLIPLGVLAVVFFIGFTLGKQRGCSKAKENNDIL